MAVAAMRLCPEIRFTSILEHEQYYRTWQMLGHQFAPTRYWRAAPRTRIGKIHYHLLSEHSAGRDLRYLLDETQVDAVHSQNYEHLGYFATKYAGRPVIHDVSDFYSIFPRNQERPSGRSSGPVATFKHIRRQWLEKHALEQADALTFNSPMMLELARQRYAISGETLVIPNAVPEEDVPRSFLPKLSVQDGYVHTVFVGHINGPKLHSLVEVADRGVHVHLYTLQKGSFDQTLSETCEDHRYLHCHGALPYRRLLQELTQYDFGLVLWYKGANEPFFQASLPSKLFDYLAAGLPVIVRPFQALVEFVQRHQCGFVLYDLDELPGKLEKTYTVGDRRKYTMEHYIRPLLDLYREMASG